MVVGLDHPDDAGVFRVRDDLYLVQTVDFFTPIVDDPYHFGRITAANALSDIYAMGGTPITALSIVAFPVKTESQEVFRLMFEGGISVLKAAECVLVGGHSIDDVEIKFGFSITGTVELDKLITKGGAKNGDALIITKPIGTGTISSAIKKGIADRDTINGAIESMAALNRIASEVAVDIGVRCGTDVTGFGLLGHLREIIVASEVSCEVFSSNIPLLPNAFEFASKGVVPGGTTRNRVFVECMVEGFEAVSQGMVNILCDPQTSGGLLLCVPNEKTSLFLDKIRERGGNAWIIGRVIEKTDHPRIIIKP